MIPTPAILARLRRSPATEPKPATTPEPAAVAEPVPARLGRIEPPPVIRVITTQTEPDDDPTKPTPTHYEAAYNELEQEREGIAVDELAAKIAEGDDPWAAAIETDGGDR